MSTDYQDICCHLTPLDEVKPEDEDFPQNMFSIEVVATFMPPLDSSMEEEEDQFQDYDLECDTTSEEFVVIRDMLLNHDARSRNIIRDFLGNVEVPIRPFMIDRILDHARRMASDNRYLGRKVLRMRVSIDVPPMFETMDEDDDDGQEVNLVPASESSIKALEMVKVEGSKQCSICLEELMIGSEATCMPCSHLYHGLCIRHWLEESKVCPLCRFEIA